jgi:hypothetical protein
MLLLDTPAQERWAVEGRGETTKAQRQQALAQEILSNTVTVEDDAGRDTSSLLAQMGRPLGSLEVQRRLHLCNPNLIFIRAPLHPELTGIYFEKDEKLATGGFAKRRIHICGMESGIMPEFSVRHATKKRVPNPEVTACGGKEVSRDAMKWMEIPTFYAETRGWRTVLIRLLHAKLINAFHVEQHFGWTPSRDSKNWHEQT